MQPMRANRARKSFLCKSSLNFRDRGKGADWQYENPVPGVKPSADQDVGRVERELGKLVRDQCDRRTPPKPLS